jgi:hypothetical protein
MGDKPPPVVITNPLSHTYITRGGNMKRSIRG